MERGNFDSNFRCTNSSLEPFILRRLIAVGLAKNVLVEDPEGVDQLEEAIM